MNSSFQLLSNFLLANIQLESELLTTSLNKHLNNCVILQEKVAS